MSQSQFIPLALLVASCAGQGSDEAAKVIVPTEVSSAPIVEPGSDAYLLAESRRYLQDASFRRQALEESLTNPSNVYSRSRLTAYGLGDRGWDMLPEWNPRVRTVDAAYVAGLRDGNPAGLDAQAHLLWDGSTPTTQAEWVTLGRKVFFGYPLRSEVFAEHALRFEEVSARVGLGADEGGVWPGVVAFETLDGDREIGITCALCHVAIEDGKMVEGRARRDFDYGEMRLAFYRDTGAFLSEDLKRRMAGWGPGRADITQDETEDPVAIVDLWGVKKHSYLTQSGTLRHKHPAAVAIRQETQILNANHERARPPRELAWALAMYLYSLEPPHKPNRPTLIAKRGRKIFRRECAHCHSEESYAGPPLPAEKIGTDPALAMGSARGTGMYRPSPLLGVAEAAPYFHDGSVATLVEVLDPQRTVPGHAYGTNLDDNDRDAVIAFLRTL